MDKEKKFEMFTEFITWTLVLIVLFLVALILA